MEVKPGYKQTEVGIIPEDWEAALLDKVAKRGSGHTPNKKHPEYWNGDIKWISLADSNALDSLAQFFRITIPAILGADLIIQIVEKIYEAVHYCLRPGLSRLDVHDVQKLADSLPEYILGPENPLTFLTPDMPCSFFGA